MLGACTGQVNLQQQPGNWLDIKQICWVCRRLIGIERAQQEQGIIIISMEKEMKIINCEQDSLYTIE